MSLNYKNSLSNWNLMRLVASWVFSLNWSRLTVSSWASSFRPDLVFIVSINLLWDSKNLEDEFLMLRTLALRWIRWNWLSFPFLNILWVNLKNSYDFSFLQNPYMFSCITQSLPVEQTKQNSDVWNTRVAHFVPLHLSYWWSTSLHSNPSVLTLNISTLGTAYFQHIDQLVNELAVFLFRPFRMHDLAHLEAYI